MNAADVLHEFGQAIGLQELKTDEHGHASLHLGSGRILTLEPGDRGMLLVGLSQPVAYDAAGWLFRAWKRAHHRHTARWPIQAGLRNTSDTPHLLVLIRLPARDQSAPGLQQAVEYLSRWLDDLRHV